MMRCIHFVLLIVWCTQLTASEASIDAILARAQANAGVTAASSCDDRTFIRRATLDLLGRVPTPEECRNFATSGDRSKLIDRLLASEEFPRYWSQLWATILVGRSVEIADREGLRNWLETAFAEGRPLDQMAFDLISAKGVSALHGPVNFLIGNNEDPVAPISRVFLGVQLDCAQCHDHPFDRWTQDDHASMQRFFDPVEFREVSGGIEVVDHGGEASEDDRPRFLTGAKPRTSAWRREMALMTVRSKPFARAMGNRVWQLLFGRGIVDPVDGLSQDQPPSVPKLHQALADQLRSQQFDLRRLVATICKSEAYGRGAPDDANNLSNAVYETFAARRLRPLLPEQLIASYATVLRRKPPQAATLNDGSVQFLGQASAGKGASDPLDIQRTSQGLLQELAADSEATLMDLDSLFMATLSRRPDEWERERLASVPASDVLYALLHCNEFVFCP
ncbi:MAG: DUF1549 domain-containing protein [Planctomycetota bacterium]